MGFGFLDSTDQSGGMILYCWVGFSSFSTLSSSKMSFGNAPGLDLIQLCRATNGCTQSEPYKIKQPMSYSYQDHQRFHKNNC